MATLRPKWFLISPSLTRLRSLLLDDLKKLLDAHLDSCCVCFLVCSTLAFAIGCIEQGGVFEMKAADDAGLVGEELAGWLLTLDSAWNEAASAEAVRLGETRQERL